MSDKRVQTVKMLLDAEEEAKRVIEAARGERDARLKQAAVEAEEQIAKYTADKEAEYQAELGKHSSSAGTESLKIRDDADREMTAVKYAAVKNKPNVVEMLYSFVTNVDLDAKQ